MAFLSITEFQSVIWAGVAGFQLVPAPNTPPLASQAVAIGGTTSSSTPFSAKVKFVEVHTDTNCVIAFDGANPAQGVQRLGANETRYYGTHVNGSISVMSSTT